MESICGEKHPWERRMLSYGLVLDWLHIFCEGFMTVLWKRDFCLSEHYYKRWPCLSQGFNRLCID